MPATFNDHEPTYSCENGDETMEVMPDGFNTAIWKHNNGLVIFASTSIDELFYQIIVHEMALHEAMQENGEIKYTINGEPSFALECVDEAGHSVKVHSGKALGYGSYELKSTYYTLNPYDQKVYFVGTITLPFFQ